MTLVQCLNNAYVENLTVCLRLKPEKLILLSDEEQMQTLVRRYKDVLRQRGLRIEVVTHSFTGKTVEQIAGMLRGILRQEKDCVLDLTDGDEIVAMALGFVAADLEERELQRLRVQKYDPEEDAFIRLMGAEPATGKNENLTIRELVELHGGVIDPVSEQPSRSCTPAQLEPLWQLVIASAKDWNNDFGDFAEFESRADSRLEVYIPLWRIRGTIANFEAKEKTVRKFLDKLDRCGIIRNQSNRDALNYTYTSPLFRYCMEKAGNTLEIKTLLEARAVRENGRSLFSDCQTSVHIDWVPKDGTQDTRNEVDAVLMHGATPLFVSCKNGNVDENELYKLNTVAERFGGPHAKKMLITTDLENKGQRFIRRAWDMDVLLVTDAAELDAEGWEEIFRLAVK